MENKKEVKKELKREAKKDKVINTHGKVFIGKVISDRRQKTVTVSWERRLFVKKYERYEKAYSKVHAHVPSNMIVEEGDIVKIQETRPISKTKHFIVVEVLKKNEGNGE